MVAARRLRRLISHDFQVALSSDGRFVALAGDDNRLTVWETSQQEPVLSKEFSGPGLSVALSLDGQLVARGGQNIDLFRVRSRGIAL